MFVNNSVKSFFVFFFLSLSIYGYYILFPTLNIDGEFSNNFMQTISLGRWFHALLKKYFLPEPFLPIFTALVAVFFLCLAGSLLIKIYACGSKEKIIAFLIFISFPQFSYQLEFLNQADTFSIGVFLCVYASALLIRKGLARLLLSACIIACAIGIYQTLILVMPTIVMTHCSLALWRKNISPRESFRLSISGFVVTAIAAFLYFVIQTSFKMYFSINADGYLLSYLTSSGNFYEYMVSVYQGVKKLLLGTKFFGEFSFILVALGLMSLFSNVFFRKDKCLPFLYAMVALFLTMLVIFLTGNSSPPRLFVTCSFMMMFVYLICRVEFSLKIMIDIIAIMAVIFNVLTLNYLFYKDASVRKSDLYIADRIVTLLQEKGGSCNNVKMYIHGRLDGINNLGVSSDTFGKSFFWWDGGNYMRAIAFMKYYGVCSAIPTDRNEVRFLYPYIQNMPIWPDEQAVKIVDGIIIVKMSDNFGWLPFDIN